jgi:hypothetical protein
MQTQVLKSLVYPLDKFLIVRKYGTKNKESLIKWISKIYITFTLALFASLNAVFPSWIKFCVITYNELSWKQLVFSNNVSGDSQVFLHFWEHINSEVSFLFFPVVIFFLSLFYVPFCGFFCKFLYKRTF